MTEPREWTQDEIDDAMLNDDEGDDFDNCMMTDDGTCQLAGTEECDECPFNPANEADYDFCTFVPTSLDPEKCATCGLPRGYHGHN